MSLAIRIVKHSSNNSGKRLFYAACFSFLFFLGCAHPPAIQPPAAQEVGFQDYVDLKPGWRLRVVFPITRSGSYVVVSEQPSEGGSVKVSDDFLGYEKSYYSVKPASGTGVRIEFTKAQVWEKDKFHSRPKTLLPLFDALANSRYVRLVYLIRASQADHNMAVVAASDPATLETLTRNVTSSAICKSSPDGVCIWTPAGVAVTPEEKRLVDGKKQWAPARP